MSKTAPHYEIRFQDGATPVDCLSMKDVDALFKECAEFEDRTCIVRGIGTQVSIADLLQVD